MPEVSERINHLPNIFLGSWNVPGNLLDVRDTKMDKKRHNLCLPGTYHLVYETDNNNLKNSQQTKNCKVWQGDTKKKRVKKGIYFLVQGARKSLSEEIEFTEITELRRRHSGIEQRKEYSRERNNMCRGRKSLVCFCEIQRTLENKERGRWGGGMACNEMERGSGWIMARTWVLF